MPNTIKPYMTSSGLTPLQDTTSIVKVTDHEKKSNPDEKSVNEIWYYVIKNKFLSAGVTGQKVDYDHRKRSWYIAASKTTSIQWSDIYVFASILRGEAGITASRSIIDQQGNFKGILAADISLKSFSEILSKNKITKNGLSFVIDGKGQIVSNSQNISNVTVSGDHYNLLSVSSFGSKALEKAINAYSAKNDEEKFAHFTFDGKEYISYSDIFPFFTEKNWKIISICPLDDFAMQIKENRDKTVLYSLIMLLISLAFTYRLSRRISVPLNLLVQETKKIQELDLNNKVKIESKIKEISDLANSISSLKTTIQSFSYYIPKSLVKKLINRKMAIHIGGRSKEIALMFTDIADFTSISESLSPDKLATHLSEYFEELTGIITNNNGTVDKYIGDAIMSFWGAPVPDRLHSYNACRSAILCQKKLYELNRIWKKSGLPVFNTRIGIHVGEVIVGNIGSSERMNYTAIGDSVNLCSRLEGLNKYYGTQIIVSESIFDQVKGQFLMRPIDLVTVKGKNKAVKIYELVSFLEEEGHSATDEQVDFCQGFEKAYNLYLAHQFEEARSMFEFMKPLNKHDLTLEMYIHRCDEYLVNPPSKDWDGVFHMLKK